MKQITAKFNSKCAETGAMIRKGEEMIYDYSTKKCYCKSSTIYKRYEDEEHEARNTRGYIEAQENAYFDNFCYANNI